MRVTQIKIHNYKSLRNISFSPLPLSILVGPNAAGKSNFCDALDFLAEAYRLGLEMAVARKGGYENICYRHHRRSKAPISFHIEFELPYESNTWPYYVRRKNTIPLKNTITVFSHYFQIRAESQNIKAPFYVSEEHVEISLKPAKSFEHQLAFFNGINEKKQFISYTRKGNKITEINYDGFKELFTDDEYKYYLPFLNDKSRQRVEDKIPSTELMTTTIERFLLANFPFRRNIGSLRVFQLSPVNCRESGVPTPNPELGRFGSNLPAVIEYLQNRHKDQYMKLFNTVKKVMPTLENLDTQYTHTKTLGLFVYESGFGRPWAPEDISDGTIHTIALLAAIFDPRNKIIIIEEPENSVHPWALRNFVQAAREASNTKQVVLTTHSPILIDQMNPSEIWVVSRPLSETIVVPLIDLDSNVLNNWQKGVSSLSEYLDSGAIPQALPME